MPNHGDNGRVTDESPGPPHEGPPVGVLAAVFLRVAIRHPVLAIESARLALATTRPGWFRRSPFLPRPEPTYRDWRLATAYGRSDTEPSTKEMVEYLQWRRTLRKTH